MKTTLDKIMHLKYGREEIPEEMQTIPFVDLFWSWMQIARQNLKKNPKIGSGVYRAFEIELMNNLSNFCTPSFVLEMHIKKIVVSLKGETSRERYLYFVRNYLQNPVYLKGFFAEYKVLANLVETTFSLWQKKTNEFFRRLEKDWTELESEFNEGNPLGFLEKINCSLSDPHMGNRRVLGLIFSSGISLYYKPKNLGIDAAFNAFINRINKLDISCSLKSYRISNHGEYGWVEAIHHLPCENKRQVEHYFKRTGMLMCLMYLLGGTDFHCENLIAENEQPVLIDLETLFNPVLRIASHIKINPKWRSSVLQTLMLPQFIMGKRGRKGVDLSGLTGGQKGMPYPSDLPQWENLNTDEMTLGYRQKESDAGKNLVFLNAELQHPSDFLPQIIDGFKEMYFLILTNREALFEKEKQLDLLGMHPARIVCRATSIYGKLMHRMTDPSLMRSESAAKEIISALTQYFIGEDEQHFLPLIKEEFQALMQRDIPYFRFYPKNLDILSGSRVIQNALVQSPFDAVMKRILDVGEADCALQIEFIRNTFYCLPTPKSNQKKSLGLLSIASQTRKMDCSEDAFFERALKIGDEILSRGFKSESSLSWIGLENLPREDQLAFQVLGESLYGGTLGIALFFSALYAKTKVAIWKNATHGAVQDILYDLSSSQIEYLTGRIGLGGMIGVGAVVYTFAKISVLLQESQFLNEALNLLSYITDKHIEDDDQLDVLGGSAGLLLALLCLPGNEVNPLAHKVATHLIASRKEIEDGKMGWKTFGDKARPGFAHGAAGIGFALMKLYLRTGERNYHDMAMEAFNFERNLYMPEKGCWPAFQEVVNYENTSWCHGAVGIGLSRLSLYSLTQNQEFLSEVENALSITSKHLMRRPHHLCCGIASRIEFLKCASQILNRKDLEIEASRALSAVLNDADRESGFNFFIDLPSNAYNPGVMQGAAGIGYCLLRFTDKDNLLPNILLLE